MQTPPPFERKRWASWQVPKSRFAQRREPHLQYGRYRKRFEALLDSFESIETETISRSDEITLERASLITRARLDNVLNWLSLQYSAGAPVELFAEVWPQTLVWAEEFAAYNSEVGTLAHVLLSSEEYWLKALRLVCFALLSGHADQMPRVMAIVDYGNARDGLLERLVAPFIPGRGAPPNIAARHLPYRKLFRIFEATPGERPVMLAHYLEEWYRASRREPYVDHHNEEMFYGYWSWEAAAVTWLLDIDDASYRDLPYYPCDLVDFARRVAQPPQPSPGSNCTPTGNQDPSSPSVPDANAPPSVIFDGNVDSGEVQSSPERTPDPAGSSRPARQIGTSDMPTTRQSFDWSLWSGWQIPELCFKQSRIPLLRYASYAERTQDLLTAIALVTTELCHFKPHYRMLASHRRVWNTLDWLSLQYSAGTPPELFIRVWPHVLRWAEEYSRSHALYRELYEINPNTDDTTYAPIPRMMLTDEDYRSFSLRLVCFGLLCGQAGQMPRVMAVLDDGNADSGDRDGLIERLVAPFVPGRATPPDTAALPRPYGKLLPVFDAEPARRPALMREYLAEWQKAGRVPPRCDPHGPMDDSLYNSWSWEAAAVTWRLGIDDASYRDLPGYPADLVAFARTRPPTSTEADQSGSITADQPVPPSDIRIRHELPWNARTVPDSDEQPLELDDDQACVHCFLHLINPGDAMTARLQFDLWRRVFAEMKKEYGDAHEDHEYGDAWLASIDETINGHSGYWVDWKDTESFTDDIDTMAGRWNLTIDWNRDLNDDEFLDAGIEELMAIACKQLDPHGYRLWRMDTREDNYFGWIAHSHHDEFMWALSWRMNIKLVPGNVP